MINEKVIKPNTFIQAQNKMSISGTLSANKIVYQPFQHNGILGPHSCLTNQPAVKHQDSQQSMDPTANYALACNSQKNKLNKTQQNDQDFAQQDFQEQMTRKINRVSQNKYSYNNSIYPQSSQQPLVCQKTKENEAIGDGPACGNDQKFIQRTGFANQVLVAQQLNISKQNQSTTQKNIVSHQNSSYINYTPANSNNVQLLSRPNSGPKNQVDPKNRSQNILKIVQNNDSKFQSKLTEHTILQEVSEKPQQIFLRPTSQVRSQTSQEPRDNAKVRHGNHNLTTRNKEEFVNKIKTLNRSLGNRSGRQLVNLNQSKTLQVLEPQILENQEDFEMSANISEIGTHLIGTNFIEKQTTKYINEFEQKNFKNALKQIQMMQETHPSLLLSRSETTEIERQNINIKVEYRDSIEQYTRQLEIAYQTDNCLARHKVTPALRARMTDWMIEVLTNFKCDDQTFFLAANLLDRYLKAKQSPCEIQDLHLMGVTCMFIASKYEDIHPLKMKVVYDKIAHKKLSVEQIKQMELQILKEIHYKIPAPTILDFLKIYLKEVLGIGHQGNTSLTKEENEMIPTNSECPEGQKLLVQKMSMYLAKMSMHEYQLSGQKPSLVAIGALYVSLKICEQLKKIQFITNQNIQMMVKESRQTEADIIEISQKVLQLAQNFDREFPGLENLKKSHFVIITQLL